MKDKVFKNTLWLFLDNVIRLSAGIFIGIWMARAFGPYQFGQFSYAAAFVILFTPLLALAHPEIIIRSLLRDKGREDDIIGGSLAIRLLGAGFGYLLCAVTATFLLRDPFLFMLVLIMGIGLFWQALDVFDAYFQSQLQGRLIMLARSGATVIFTAVKVFMFIQHLPLVWFAWVGVLELALIAAIFVFVYRIHCPGQGHLNFRRADFESVLRDSWPMFLSAGATIVFYRVDHIIIGFFRSPADIGFYASAVRVSEAWHFLPFILSQTFYPILIELKKTDQHAYKSLLRTYIFLLIGVGALCAAAISIWASDIIQILLGASFAAAAPVLAVHVWGGYLITVAFGLNSWLLAEDLQTHRLAQCFVVCVLSVFLNIIFIPRFGLMGAAWCTIASQLGSWAILFSLRRVRMLASGVVTSI